MILHPLQTNGNFRSVGQTSAWKNLHLSLHDIILHRSQREQHPSGLLAHSWEIWHLKRWTQLFKRRVWLPLFWMRLCFKISRETVVWCLPINLAIWVTFKPFFKAFSIWRRVSIFKCDIIMSFLIFGVLVKNNKILCLIKRTSPLRGSMILHVFNEITKKHFFSQFANKRFFDSINALLWNDKLNAIVFFHYVRLVWQLTHLTLQLTPKVFLIGINLKKDGKRTILYCSIMFVKFCQKDGHIVIYPHNFNGGVFQNEWCDWKQQ